MGGEYSPKMHINVQTGAESRASEFARTLDRLKHTGCNLLLVGCASDDVFTTASQKLLGDTIQRRFRLFVLTDGEQATVRQRLPATGFELYAEYATALNYATTPRSSQDDRDAESGSVTRMDIHGDLDELYSSIDDTISAFEATSERFDPAQLRVCFDSLEPLLADHSACEVATFLESVTDRVQAANGMAHYVLPVEYEHEMVDTLAPLFEATIEYRDAEDGQERWHFPETGVTTQWFPLR